MDNPGDTSILARFVAAPGVLVDGQRTRLRVDNTGALVITGGGGGAGLPVVYAPPLSFDTGGVLATSGIIRATPGTLLDVNGFNNSGAIRYFMLFNTVAVPADATVADVVPIQVPPGSHFSLTFASSQGRSFSTGITWASSTTNLVKTITGAADMLLNAQHRDP